MTDASSEPAIDNPDLVHWSPKRGPSIGPALNLSAGSYAAAGGVGMVAAAFGALAVGALAIGALAVGRLVVGRTDLKDVRVGRLVVDELVVLKRSSRAD